MMPGHFPGRIDVYCQIGWETVKVSFIEPPTERPTDKKKIKCYKNRLNRHTHTHSHRETQHFMTTAKWHKDGKRIARM